MSVALRAAERISLAREASRGETPAARRAKFTMQRIASSWSATDAERSVCAAHLLVGASRCS
jgi:hypothetical protein